ncbi:MAG: S8 family serine peptidase, partial [Thermoplasmata archaeon]|nr:S8 family serine peptidase [Thermoplasmata archaeon]
MRRGLHVLLCTIVLTTLLIVAIPPQAQGLDVSCRAIKARGSDEYSPNTAWELGYTGAGVNIAIMDSGVDDEHPALQGAFVAGADFIASFVPMDGSHNPGGDYNEGHGTWVAGCALSRGAPGGEYLGAAPNAGLIDLKIFDQVGGPVINKAAPEEGLRWAIEHKEDFNIRIASTSIGDNSNSNGTDEYSKACEEAYEAGIVVISSIGNLGPDNIGIGNPASDHCISVGAIDDMSTVDRTDDSIADLSSRGPRKSDDDNNPYDELKPDIVAPGISITTTDSFL